MKYNLIKLKDLLKFDNSNVDYYYYIVDSKTHKLIEKNNQRARCDIDPTDLILFISKSKEYADYDVYFLIKRNVFFDILRRNIKTNAL